MMRIIDRMALRRRVTFALATLCAAFLIFARARPGKEPERLSSTTRRWASDKPDPLRGESGEALEAADAVWKRFDELDAILSDWDQESEVIRVCRAAGETGDFVHVSDDLRRVC